MSVRGEGKGRREMTGGRSWRRTPIRQQKRTPPNNQGGVGRQQQQGVGERGREGGRGKGKGRRKVWYGMVIVYLTKSKAR